MSLYCARRQELVLWKAIINMNRTWLKSEIELCQRRQYRPRVSLI